MSDRQSLNLIDGSRVEGSSADRTEVTNPATGETIASFTGSTDENTAATYTEEGGVARHFASRVDTGQVGINVGTPALIAFYPVGGRKNSFYGSLRGRANDAIDFYTDKKVIVSTWHSGTTAATRR